MFWILFAGPAVPQNPLSFFVLAGAVFLGLWAIWTMSSSSSFNGTPEVIPGAKLVMTGPYKYIRHPMYTAIIIGGLGLFLNDLSIFRLFLLLLLQLLLLYKIRLEEYYLSQMFSQFKEYASKTSKLIPGIL
jgi:protein-S-isoprenylcysteine O-methyltransferase Ste14